MQKLLRFIRRNLRTACRYAWFMPEVHDNIDNSCLVARPPPEGAGGGRAARSERFLASGSPVQQPAREKTYLTAASRVMIRAVYKSFWNLLAYRSFALVLLTVKAFVAEDTVLNIRWLVLSTDTRNSGGVISALLAYGRNRISDGGRMSCRRGERAGRGKLWGDGRGSGPPELSFTG
ncbi:hypothetical protein EVAR_10879_1 [Eumeta japonica]|uniref:Uncharacterized protein n=1 Tax=Eumeta variegata TaxID=151549 RepID=A0A4C1URF7_EUMVA|nr:hypothetical protein EVAR_10879_1 [Eumeta japonica]